MGGVASKSQLPMAISHPASIEPINTSKLEWLRKLSAIDMYPDAVLVNEPERVMRQELKKVPVRLPARTRLHTLRSCLLEPLLSRIG